MSDDRRSLILTLYLVGISLQGVGTIWALIVAVREATRGLLPRDNAHGWREHLRRARPIVLPSIMLVIGLLFEIAATWTWLYS